MFIAGVPMLEFELVVKEVEKLFEKEKGMRRRIHLENALRELREYVKLEPKP